MKLPKSKLGIALMAIYIICFIFLIAYSLASVECREFVCPILLLLLAVIPWSFILPGLSAWLYVFSVPFNLIVLYVLGWGIERLIEAKRKRPLTQKQLLILSTIALILGLALVIIALISLQNSANNINFL